MINAISQNRVVPVQEDLTTEETRLSVIRGLENMFRVDVKFDPTESFEMGDWATLGADGIATAPGSTPVAETYLVFAGNDRFDAAATGKITLIMNSPARVKSSKYNTGTSYAVGDALTVKDLGGGERVVTKQASSEPVLARVVEVGDSYLVYDLVASTTGN